MISEQDLSNYYSSLAEIYKKALEDVAWHLSKFLGDSNRFRDDPNQYKTADKIARIYTSSKVSHRVKPMESLWRKCRREEILTLDNLPNSIEDILGIRVATANKAQAQMMFEYLEKQKTSWFCKAVTEPKFVPYTISARNKYSVETGYQAYHVTFIYERSFAPVTTISRWPVEIQIMAQLWEFWANYSRSYFYGGSHAKAAQLLPYNTAISKVLDSADDLIIATTDILLHAEREEEEIKKPRATKVARVAVADVRTWFEKNITKYFGERAKVPIDYFLSKIAEELNLYDVPLDQLEKILQDEKINSTYNEMLKVSNVAFLPPYQRILCAILLGLGWDNESVVKRVNEELSLLGFRLRTPEASGT